MNVSDRIHVLDQGRTLAEGTAAEVRAQPGGDRSLSRRLAPGRRPPVLSVESLSSRYGRIEVLHGVSIDGCGRRDRHAGRRQRRRQDHAAARDLRRAADHRPAASVFDGRPIERLPAPRARRARHRAGPRGPAGVRAAFASRTTSGSAPGPGATTIVETELATASIALFPMLERERAKPRPARSRAASSRCWRSAAR